MGVAVETTTSSVEPMKIELSLKKGGDNYAACAGIYTEYSVDWCYEKIFSNTDLHRVILFYGGKY